MKSIDIKSLLIGALLTSTVILGVAATGSKERVGWDNEQKWQCKSVDGFKIPQGWEPFDRSNSDSFHVVVRRRTNWHRLEERLDVQFSFHRFVALMLALTIGGLLGYGCIGFLWLLVCFQVGKWASERYDDCTDPFHDLAPLFFFLGSLIGGPALVWFFRKYVSPLIAKFLSIEIF